MPKMRFTVGDRKVTYDGYYGQRSFLRADSERVLARYVVAMAHCYVMIPSMFTPNRVHWWCTQMPKNSAEKS